MFSPMPPTPIPLGALHACLLPQRVVWVPALRTLLVADLHWGREAWMRLQGSPVPEGPLEDDLCRLEGVLDQTGAAQVLVVGDLIHARAGLTPDVIDRVARFRRRYPVAWGLVRGNHERRLAHLPPEWAMDELGDEVLWQGLRLVHEPPVPVAGAPPAVSGHLHPTCRVGRGSLALRLPCLAWQPHQVVLPAFSPVTRGVVMVPGPHCRVWAITPTEVIEVPGRGQGNEKPNI
jgi:DNA ligase-associated metallophosphoesterase